MCMAILLQRIHTVLENYLEEERRVKEEIYGVLMDLGSIRVVVDIGCGDSTRSILSTLQNTFVICVDVKPKTIATEFMERYEAIVADARYLPLRDNCCDIATLIFTLHEIDPQTHIDVVLEARRVAKYIVIAEPSPHGTELYEKFWQTYRDAVRSIGLFEDYKPREYWIALLKQADLQILIDKIIKWRISTPKEVLEDMIKNIIEEWGNLGIKHKYIESIKSILYTDKEFKWSDIFLFVGAKATK